MEAVFVGKALYTVLALNLEGKKEIPHKGGFPTENSLLKLLYVGINNASKRKFTNATAEVENAKPTCPKGPTNSEFMT